MGTLFNALHDRQHRRRCQCCNAILDTQIGDIRQQIRKFVPVQRLRRHSIEKGARQKPINNGVTHIAARRKFAIAVKGLISAPRNEIIDQRISRPCVHRQQRQRVIWPVLRGIDPRQIRNAADIQKHDRRSQAQILGQRIVEKRHQRRTFAAHLNIRRSEIPDNRLPQNLGQNSTITDLQRTASLGLMRNGLSVKANQINVIELRQNLGMGGFHDFRGRFQNIPVPLPECGAQLRAFAGRIGPKRHVPKAENLFPIGVDNCCVDPIK